MELRKKRYIKRGIIVIALIFLTVIVLSLAIDKYVVKTSTPLIVAEINNDKVTRLSDKELELLKEKNAECILILGAGLQPDGTPSYMLADRLEVGLALYNEQVAPKILLTGDHGQKGYDEVNAMKKYMVDSGVKEEDIFLDHAGFSTYESMYRAKEIFNVDTAIVVTQKYHQYRAIYIADKLGYNAYGVSSDQKIYVGQEVRDVRESLARIKDFAKTIYKPSPTYLGDAIPISGNGMESWD